MQLVQLILRPAQLLFLAVVIGLSATLTKGQVNGDVPARTTYVLFCGVFGFIVAVVGIATAFIEKLQGVIILTLDSLTTGLLLAAGIAYAIGLGVHSCSLLDGEASPYLCFNTIINGGGFYYEDGQPTCEYDAIIHYSSRCHEAQATTAFIFFALAVFIGSTIHDVMSTRRSARTGRV